VVLALAALLQAASGPPLAYWGSRPPVIATEPDGARGDEARVLEVHAARREADLVLRLTLDRPVRSALYLPRGEPVSGRLHAVLYLDADAERSTGLDEGPGNLRTGADYRLEIGVLMLGEDAEEKRRAAALVTASLAALAADGRRRDVWQTDDAAQPRRMALYGEWVEVRLPGAVVALRPGARLVLAQGQQTWDGRLPAEGR
jgi:hypothetical protein